jgi:hypothetical protein
VSAKAPCTETRLENGLRESGLREEVVQACQVLYAVKAAGDGLGGHLSVRLDEQRILIKPRPVSWRRLKPEELIVIDFNGKMEIQASAALCGNGRFMRGFMQRGPMSGASYMRTPALPHSWPRWASKLSRWIRIAQHSRGNFPY